MLRRIGALAARTAGPGRIVSVDGLDASGSSDKRRSFWRIGYEGADGPIELFVKLRSLTLRNAAFETRMDRLGLAVPRYIGSVWDWRSRAFVWRYFPGTSYRQFGKVPRAAIDRLGVAVARIELAVAPPRRAPVGWVRPAAARLRALLGTDGLAFGEAEVALIARHEEDAIAFMRSRPSRVLVHNDLKAPNVLFSEDDLCIVDWESARPGPFGASLRVFARSAPAVQQRLVRSYVATLKAHGAEIEAAEILRTLQLQETFWALSTGMSQMNVKRLNAGVRLAERYLAGEATR